MFDYNSNKGNDILVIIFVWLSAIASLMSNEINRIALYIVLPLGFTLSFLSYKTLLVNKYFNLLSILYLWVFCSVLWSTDTSLALEQINKVLGCYILSYIFTVKALNIKNISWLYITYIFLLAFAWYYAYHNIFSIIELGQERVNDEKLNANTLAYYTFYVTFSIYILGESAYKDPVKKILELIFILTIPLSIITAIYTASRQVLIIQIPFSVALLYIRYIKERNFKAKLFAVILMLMCIIALYPVFYKEYEDSLLQHRNEIEITDESRVKLASDAFNVGLDYFPLGVGAGNYVLYSYDKHFSHNVYLELFANVGIIGLIIYTCIIAIFLRRQWQRYMYYKDNMYLSFFLFGFFYCIDGIFYSFYESLWLIGFFMLVASHSESYFELSYYDDIENDIEE